MEIFSTITLLLSGLLLLAVGVARLTKPLETYAKNSGITLTKDVNLLNEMRGVSAVMLCSGIIILLGITLPRLTISSHIVAGLMFLGFAIGRLISIGVDGKPNKLIINGLWFELFFGAVNVVGLVFILV